MNFRQGSYGDVEQLRLLGLASWKQFQSDLTPDNWQKLFNNLNHTEMYAELLTQSHCIVCENAVGAIIGMAFLVPRGNPTDIFQADWSYLRYVTVHPDFSGLGIGRQLTEKCIEIAKRNKEHTVALHTSEMMHKARHIYESLGFTILREIEPRQGKKYWLYTLAIA
ncbi:GNAT family N-acetyltransferase [Telluribacter humicola]|uniref:GNAT family N-acetyltransferase n=1 Tax=Telluribacter humicola TaxID=1720261 RepID=UPI001A97830C|nr:GNAT family N-acetyltransferase [Telluribacter humicola]